MHSEALTQPAGPGGRARVGLAAIVALVALAAAIIGAVGPSATERTTYSWPPRDLPSGMPSSIWYSPLILARQRPDAISATFACTLPRALPHATRPFTLLATARDPATAGGLAVTVRQGRMVVTVGTETLAEVSASTRSDESCTHRLVLDDRHWSLDGGSADATEGDLGGLPVVTGLFSTADLRDPTAPAIDVTTAVHATRVGVRQEVAWALAAVAALAALLLASGQERKRGLASGRGRVVWEHAHPCDGVVVLALVGWVFLSPVFWDDGWVVARERTFAASRGFSTYFDAFGVNLPLDYWVEWLQHWITQSTTSVPLMRLPALVCLLGVWGLCRWSFAQIAVGPRAKGDVVLWALAAAFLAEAFAWGMTIRPEPVTALLATSVMACAVQFRKRARPGPVVVAAVLVPLALTAHHTGIVALAPVLAVSPQLAGWARRAWASFLIVVTASFALLVVLAFVGSDVAQRLSDARTSRDAGITQSWRDELQRYTILGDFPFAAPLRRGSAALILLAVLAYAVRRQRGHRALFDLPAITLAISLVLFLATTSKLPWHFGALAGFTALAVAAETLRLRKDVPELHGWSARWFVVLGGIVLVPAWAWGLRGEWNPVDLRTLNWTTLPHEDVVPFTELAVLLPLIAVFAAVFVDALRGVAPGLSRAPGHVAAATAPILAIPLLLFTVGVLAADAARTDSWTVTRQNLGSFVGREGCGLADDVVVPDAAATTPLTPTPPTLRNAAGAVPPSPVVGGTPIVLRAEPGATATSSWYDLPERSSFGVFIAGLHDADLRVQWGKRENGKAFPVNAGGVDIRRTDIETDSWSFVAGPELPQPESDARSLRFVLAGGDGQAGGAVALAPVTYIPSGLSDRIRVGTTLVHPNLLLYFPCAKQPLLDEGVVQPPDHIIWFDHPFQPHPYEPTSSFLGLQDLYRVRQLPTSDSANPPDRVVVFDVDRTIPGAQIAPPDRTLVVS